MFEERGGLGGEGDDAFFAHVGSFLEGKIDEGFADMASLVGGVDIDGAQFDGGGARVGGEAEAADDAFIDFVNLVFADIGFNGLAGARAEGIIADGGAGEGVDGSGILSAGRPDPGIGIGMDHGTDTDLGEDLHEEAVVNAAIDDVGAGDAAFDGLDGEACFGADGGIDALGLFIEDFTDLGDIGIEAQIALVGEAGVG